MSRRHVEAPNETTEMWRLHRRDVQARNAKRRDAGIPAINALTERGHTVTWLSPYQARIDGVVDLFPTHRKYHVLKTGQRGGYRAETPEQLLSRIL
jgi:hypothetical protein